MGQQYAVVGLGAFGMAIAREMARNGGEVVAVDLDIDRVERLKDEVAYNLQMCDQLTYDNVFVYFQPGNGKIKIKEPTDAVNKAISQITEVVNESK